MRASQALDRAANRQDSATGPCTPEGKAISARNAVKHGLTAKEVVLFDESADEFESFRAGIATRLMPADTLEIFLVERIATCAWRLRRAQRIERQIFAQYNSINFFSPLDIPSAGAVFALDAVAGGKIEKLARHEAAIERSMLRALHELQRLQAARAGVNVPVPEAIEMNVVYRRTE